MESPLPIEINLLKKATLQYRAINNPLRQKLLQQIHKEGGVAVTALYKTLKLTQSVASLHLAILRKAGFVQVERKGKFIYYTVHYQKLAQMHIWTEAFLQKARTQKQTANNRSTKSRN